MAENETTLTPRDDDDDLLVPGEVAQMFRVDPKTVTRWAKAGRIPCVRTLGGHRRYRRRDIRLALLKFEDPQAS